MVLPMKIFKRKDQGVSDDWTVATGIFEDGPIVIRVNRGCAALEKTHPIQIGVSVPLREPVPGGLPSPQEDGLLGAIEEALLAEAKGQAVLAAVITTGTMREFVLYSPSSQWIEGFHHALDDAVTTHEIQVMAKTDADWSIYKSLAEG